METGVITDSQLSSSSELNIPNGRIAAFGRLHKTPFPWCAGESDTSPSYTVDLLQPMLVTGIAIMGDTHVDNWITEFKLMYSIDGATFKSVLAKGGGTPKASKLCSDLMFCVHIARLSVVYFSTCRLALFTTEKHLFCGFDYNEIVCLVLKVF